MNNINTRRDKISSIIIMQQTYCPTCVSTIKSLYALTDTDIDELYKKWIEYKVKLKKYSISHRD